MMLNAGGTTRGSATTGGSATLVPRLQKMINNETRITRDKETAMAMELELSHEHERVSVWSGRGGENDRRRVTSWTGVSGRKWVFGGEKFLIVKYQEWDGLFRPGTLWIEILVKSGMHEDQGLFGLKSQWSLGWFIQMRDYLDSLYKTKCLFFFFF